MKKVIRVVLMASLCTGYVHPFAMDWKLWGVGVSCTLIGGIGSFIYTYYKPHPLIARENERLGQSVKELTKLKIAKESDDALLKRFGIKLNHKKQEVSLFKNALSLSQYTAADNTPCQWLNIDPLECPDNLIVNCCLGNRTNNLWQSVIYPIVAGQTMILDEVALKSMQLTQRMCNNVASECKQ